jgi:hypothetical protein
MADTMQLPEMKIIADRVDKTAKKPADVSRAGVLGANTNDAQIQAALKRLLQDMEAK